MGSHNSRNSSYPHQAVPIQENFELTEVDINYLVPNTGHRPEHLNTLFTHAVNSEGRINKREFVKLFSQLRPQPHNKIESIFEALDYNHHGFVTPNELLVAYALTNKGDLRHRLNYAFDLYDTTNRGYLEKEEAKELLIRSLELLATRRRIEHPQALADRILHVFGHKNRLNKEEFIEAVLSNTEIIELLELEEY